MADSGTNESTDSSATRKAPDGATEEELSIANTRPLKRLRALEVTFPEFVLHPEAKHVYLKFFSSSELGSICRALGTPVSTTYIRVNLLVTTREEMITQLTHFFQGRFVFEADPVMPEVIVCVANEEGFTKPLPTFPEVFVDSYCAGTILRGADVAAPGIVGMAPRIIAQGMNVSVFQTFGGVTATTLDFEAVKNKMFLGNGIVQMSRKEFLKSDHPAEEIGVRLVDRHFLIPSIGSMWSDSICVQSLPSILATRALDPQPGEIILDACAAPGVKTTHIATLMNNTGRVIAVDRKKSGIQKLNQRCDEWQLTNVRALTDDVTQLLWVGDLPIPYPKQISTGKMVFPPESVDRVLCDVPCSGHGIRPAWKDSNPFDLRDIANYQRRILLAAAYLVKVGGIIVYTTRTICPLENEENIAYAVRYFNLEVVPQGPFHVGGVGLASSSLSEEDQHLVQRFNPADANVDASGFFIAKLRKKASLPRPIGMLTDPGVEELKQKEMTEARNAEASISDDDEEAENNNDHQ